MKTNITRRQVLGTLAAVAFTPPDSLLSIAEADKPGDELPLPTWIEQNWPNLPNLAAVLAQWERQAVGHRCNYVRAIQWRAGVCLVYGFGTLNEARDSSTASRVKVCAACIEELAAGCSEDWRAWTLFVRADANRVRKVLGIDQGDTSP